MPRSLPRLIVALLIYSVALQAAAPHGWYLAGSKPAEYESGVDSQNSYNGHPSAYLRAKENVSLGFGTLMQDFRAEKYAGKRLRLTAFAKTEAVQRWAGLWMRIDKGSVMQAFDNMENRPLKGTSDWQKYEVVLDVPQDATGIFFGVLLSGPGSVWLNSVKVEVVGKEVATTNLPTNLDTRPDQPVNLSFEE